jgi:hypothetical protein
MDRDSTRVQDTTRCSLEPAAGSQKSDGGSVRWVPISAVAFVAAIAIFVYLVFARCPCTYCDVWMCMRVTLGFR